MSDPWEPYRDSVGDVVLRNAEGRTLYIVYFEPGSKVHGFDASLWKLDEYHTGEPVWILMGPYVGAEDPPGRKPVAKFASIDLAWAAALMMGLTPWKPSD